MKFLKSSCKYDATVICTVTVRALVVATFSIFLFRIYSAWKHTQDVTLILLAAGETITIGIYAFSRRSKQVSFDFISICSTVCATFYFLLVILDHGTATISSFAGNGIQMAGIFWQIFSKISLGRSFGLLPANRGVVSGGAYKLVRHPIYLGYLIAHIGFLLASFSWRNLALYSALYFFQVLRILREEKLLKRDPEYRFYMEKTRYRLIPGLF